MKNKLRCFWKGHVRPKRWLIDTYKIEGFPEYKIYYHYCVRCGKKLLASDK